MQAAIPLKVSFYLQAVVACLWKADITVRSDFIFIRLLKRKYLHLWTSFHFTVTLGVLLLCCLTPSSLITPVVEKLPFIFKSWIWRKSISIFKARNIFVLTRVMRFYSFSLPTGLPWAFLEKLSTEGGRGGRCGRKRSGRKHQWPLSGQDKIALTLKCWRYLQFIQQCVTETSGFLFNVHVGLYPLQRI